MGARNARPWQVPIVAVRRRAGVRHPVLLSARMADLVVGDAVVPADGAIVVDLVAEAIGENITVTGEIRAPFAAICRRCLEAMESVCVAEVLEVFEPHPVEGETYPLGREILDLELMVRESILLNLPVAPVCRPDCPGPAADRYPTGLAGSAIALDGLATASQDEPPADPRWAVLRNLDLPGEL